MSQSTSLAIRLGLWTGLLAVWLFGSVDIWGQGGAPGVCFNQPPGRYELDLPAAAGNEAGIVVAIVGAGGRLESLIEPGGVEIVAAAAALLPVYRAFLPEGLIDVPCPWVPEPEVSLPSGGTGGLASDVSGGGVGRWVLIAAAGGVAALVGGGVVSGVGRRGRRM